MPAMRCVRSAPLRGRNPSNTNLLVDSPLMTNAIVSAEAPGIAETVMPDESAALTRRSPGSLMPGVPASLTSATLLPPSIRCTTSSQASCSVCSLITMYFLPEMPRCCSNKPVRRVSSQHTTSALLSASVARCVMSPKLPMGVATNINVPPLMAYASLRLRQVAGPNVQTIQLLPQSLFAQKTREAARDFCSHAAP